MKKRLEQIGWVPCNTGPKNPQGRVPLYREVLIDTPKNLSYIEKRKKQVAL